MIHITADDAVYIPPSGDEPLSGGWMLTGASTENLNIAHAIYRLKFLFKLFSHKLS